VLRSSVREGYVLALTLAVVVAAVVFVLATTGLLIGPDAPRSGPEAWIARDARMKPQEKP
jgi:hypothetical protein